jgi:anti-sigma factor RsiW
MTLSRETMMDLMAYADGELADEELARVEALLARSDEARRVVSAIESPAIGAWLEASTTERAEAAKASGIADAVMLRVAAEASKPSGGAVVSMRRRNAVLAVAAGALALAAAGLLYVKSRTAPAGTVVAQVATQHPTETAPPGPGAPAETGEGIEVNEVEAPARDVSVYYLDPSASPLAPNTNSVVIWIGDESRKKTGGK